jgi:hypothetical protein
VILSGSFSGSFQGDGSNLTGLVTASHVVTASFADTATSASIAITSGTSSVADRATLLSPLATASFADSATTSSYTSATSSFANRATSASIADSISQLATSSFADSSTSSSFALTGHGVFSGSFSGSLIQGTSGSFSNLTATTFTETSAERFKTNIQSIEPQLDNILKLNPVTFDWIEDKREDIGLIAEQVNEIYPEFVGRNPAGEIQGIKYSKLTTILIKSIQELKEEVEILKTKING